MKLLIPLNIPEIFGISIEVYIIFVIIGVPVYFIWRWIFKKINKLNKLDLPTKIAVWIATIIATPVLYAVLILIWVFIIQYYPNYDFDKKAWLTNKDERYEYSEDLIDSKMLIGKTKTAVRQLLGDEGNPDNSDDWYYELGYRPEFGNIDSDSLEIEFKGGKVVNVEQHKH